MNAVLTPRCATCREHHPSGCAYYRCTVAYRWSCETCGSSAHEVVNSNSSDRMLVTVIECECGARWELLNMLTPLNEKAAA